jgi:hypothetical protein
MGRRIMKVVITANTTENTGMIMKLRGPPMSPVIKINIPYRIIGVAVKTIKQIAEAMIWGKIPTMNPFI